jgi:hypothetical protein
LVDILDLSDVVSVYEINMGETPISGQKYLITTKKSNYKGKLACIL